MDIKIAAKLTNVIVDGMNNDSHSSDDYSQKHLEWMLNGIEEGYIQHEKAHRWLGFVQGALVALDICTVEKLKEVNKAA